MKKIINDDDIIRECKNSSSMAEACSKLNLHWNTFRKRAIYLGVFSKNQAGKGMKKPKSIGHDSFLLSDILEGKHPQYQSNKLRMRILSEGIKKPICELCKNDQWNGKNIPLELNHIDGNRNNHRLENLEILCPNCHAQTVTYRGKNMKKILYK